MAPKAKAAAASSKKESKAEKAAEKPASKKAGKADKAAEKEAEVAAATAGAENVVDQDELEEAEDAAAAASGGSSSDAALAAASGSGEMSASFKNFRHHPDMENFYRFIYENDLRHEALAIIDKIMVEKLARRTAGKPGKAAH